MKIIIIFLITAFSISSEIINFKLVQTFNFNMNAKGECLVDGKKDGRVYQIIVKKECSTLNFKPRAKVTCNVKKLIKTIENNIPTFSGTGDCK